MKKLWVDTLMAAALIASFAASAETAFPYRKRYPDVPLLETAELYKRLNKVTVVDVRSNYEYRTLRIKGAVNISLSDRDFPLRVKALREKTDNAIVFYCNGVTCHKSYDATLLAKNNRIPDVYAYDAGIFAWTKAYPERAELLGKSPVTAGDLIDAADFKARLLAPADFITKAAAGNAIVLDVRDRIQRDNPLFPLREQRAQLDDETQLLQLFGQAKGERKTLLVYDAAGKQVQWLQYQLQAQGIKNYYFMKGGARAFWEHKFGKVVTKPTAPAATQAP